MKNLLNTAYKIHFAIEQGKKWSVRIIALAALAALVFCTW